MGGCDFGVLAGEGGLVAGQAAEGGFGFAQAEFAGLVEGRQGFGDAGDGYFVRGYVEV